MKERKWNTGWKMWTVREMKNPYLPADTMGLGSTAVGKNRELESLVKVHSFCPYYRVIAIQLPMKDVQYNSCMLVSKALYSVKLSSVRPCQIKVLCQIVFGMVWQMIVENLTEEHTTVCSPLFCLSLFLLVSFCYFILFLSVLSIQDRQRRQGKDQLLLQVVDHNSSGKIEFGY